MDAMTCGNISKLPDFNEVQNTFGNWAYFLYGLCTIVSFTLIVQYLIMVYKFNQLVPRERLKHTLWINSVYVTVAILTSISILLPKTGPLVWSMYKIFVGIAMSKFVALLFIWIGGEKVMMSKFIQTTHINLR